MSRGSSIGESEAGQGEETPSRRRASLAANGGGVESSAAPASRIRLVVIEAEGDAASLMTALDSVAAALAGAAR